MFNRESIHEMITQAIARERRRAANQFMKLLLETDGIVTRRELAEIVKNLRFGD